MPGWIASSRWASAEPWPAAAVRGDRARTHRTAPPISQASADAAGGCAGAWSSLAKRCEDCERLLIEHADDQVRLLMAMEPGQNQDALLALSIDLDEVVKDVARRALEHLHIDTVDSVAKAARFRLNRQIPRPRTEAHDRDVTTTISSTTTSPGDPRRAR